MCFLFRVIYLTIVLRNCFSTNTSYSCLFYICQFVVHQSQLFKLNWSGNHQTKHVNHRSFSLFHLQVNDLPDFLSGKDREHCQHIRITYVTEKPVRRRRQWLRIDQRSGLSPAGPPSRRTSHCPTITHTLEGKDDILPHLKKVKQKVKQLYSYIMSMIKLLVIV